MLCHTDNTNRAYECLQQIKAMLRLGIRSPGWNMRSHVAKAKSNSVISKEIKWIEKLAQVITAEVRIAYSVVLQNVLNYTFLATN